MEGPRILACHPVLVDGIGSATQNPHTAPGGAGPPHPARPVWRPAARRCSSWLGRRVASLRPGRPCRGMPWAEAPAEPLPPQTTDVDRPGLPSPALDWLALEDPGWSWGRCRKDRAARPAWRRRRPPSLSLLALAFRLLLPPACPPAPRSPPGLRGAQLCYCHHAECLLPGADVLSRAWASPDRGPAGLPAAASSWSRPGHKQGVGILPAVHLCFHGKVERHPKMQFHCRQ